MPTDSIGGAESERMAERLASDSTRHVTDFCSYNKTPLDWLKGSTTITPHDRKSELEAQFSDTMTPRRQRQQEVTGL